MYTLEDGELGGRGAMTVSLIAVILSGFVVVGRKVVALATALTERLNMGPGLLKATAIAAARLTAAGSSADCPLVGSAVSLE